LVVYGSNTLLVADRGNHVIRAVDLSTRIITRWAGTGTAGSTGDGGDKLMAAFNNPISIALLPTADLLVTDANGCRVRRISAGGVVRLFAGTGMCSSTGDGGSALSATLNWPHGLHVYTGGGDVVVYVADLTGNRVRWITGERTTARWGAG
jgi:hypothetical protein